MNNVLSQLSDGYTASDILAMLPTALGAFTENQWGPIDTNQLSTVHDILRQNRLTVLDAVKAVGLVRGIQNIDLHKIEVYLVKT